MSYLVELSASARLDLIRLHEHLLSRAETHEDIEAAQHAITAIGEAVSAQLKTNPFICRKATAGGRRRELVIPFGRTGYVALFEVIPTGEEAQAKVLVLAVRHQREEDYH
ncbi:MAG TPA: type II toxin-antitoxin system RelE/ParE family toxin [Ideonella sp.]|uniref:type II toxin-antitoxin system RelE/ParE family toxin n=1 Tax=Ideonella sp. TaxID=1929293 RepID=UPI002BFFDAD2|nr:type II toxin-antitoxin system RelE/ParE family toxin [Ideonella sp.]HSI47662.1 type II toxin-antitoxin system RelE/ParE family toxin [Ideonella sp.]